jgi:hypothetical protein
VYSPKGRGGALASPKEWGRESVMDKLIGIRRRNEKYIAGE